VGSLASELRPIAAGLAAAPRVYADANLPAPLVDAMRRRLKWDVLFVIEDDELRRAADALHFRRAREFGRTLITLDRDFLDHRRFPPAVSPGVVVCAAPDDRALLNLLRLLDRAFRAAAPGVAPFLGRKLELVTGVGLRDV
jgi:predicted nuclease of predicted toxin-antitoxin system